MLSALDRINRSESDFLAGDVEDGHIDDDIGILLSLDNLLNRPAAGSPEPPMMEDLGAPTDSGSPRDTDSPKTSDCALDLGSPEASKILEDLNRVFRPSRAAKPKMSKKMTINVQKEIAKLQKKMAELLILAGSEYYESDNSDSEGSDSTGSVLLPDEIILNKELKILSLEQMTNLYHDDVPQTATVKIHGEATRLMQLTKSATIIAKIESPEFAKQVKKYMDYGENQTHFGLCSHHKLVNGHPWKNTLRYLQKGENDERNEPDGVMCCIRREYCFKETDCVICEMTFVKDGKLVYVEDVAQWPQMYRTEEKTDYFGESSAYLGTYRSMYKAATEFTISLETKQPTPVVACTEFETAEALRKELERRAKYFKADIDWINEVEANNGVTIAEV